MNDDQLSRLLRQVNEPASPDAAFADRLFDQLTRETSKSRGVQSLLLVAALTLLAALAVGAAVGSGLLKLPWLAVEVTPQPSSLPVVTNSAAPSSSATSTSSMAPSMAPSAPPPPISSSGLFDLLPARQPAGFVSKIACSGSIGGSDPVALVQLHGAAGPATERVLRDYADPANPRTVCTFGVFENVSVTSLIDARHVVIEDPGSGTYTYAVVDLPEVRYHWFQLPGDPATLRTFIAVGPGLDQVLWMTGDQASGTDKIHVTTHAGDEVIAALPNAFEGLCGGPEEGSKLGAYTRSGADFFVLDQPKATLNSLLVAAGQTAVLSVLPPAGGWAPGAQPATALWSPISETLFYHQGEDVWTWSPGSNPKRFLAGVNWLHPTITPDGANLAYSVARPDGSHDVYLVDLAHGGSPQVIGKGARNDPVFLNSTQLWYMTEVPQGCTGPGGKPLIYNVVDGSESPSIVDYVLGVWPATSSDR
jgi:hypothetical protein